MRRDLPYETCSDVSVLAYVDNAITVAYKISLLGAQTLLRLE